MAGRVRLTTFFGIAGGVLLLGALGGFAALGWVLVHLPAPAPPPAPPPVVAVAAPARPPPPAVAAAVPRQEIDQELFSWVGRTVQGGRREDVVPDRRYRVDVFQDAGKPAVNLVKVDLDRDGRWDEKVTLDADRLTREVASADDEWYDLVYRWDGNAWVR